MKYLKTYKTYEMVTSSDLESDVKDMFLELEDLGYQVNVDLRPQGVEMFCFEASNDRLFQWSDVREYFERGKVYTCQSGFELTKIHIGFYGPQIKIMETMNFFGNRYEHFLNYVTKPEFIERNKIYEIAFIFDPVK
jgi:hypothetical protein